MPRKSLRIRRSGRKNLLLASIIVAFTAVGLLAAGVDLFSMSRVGDAFAGWIGVEIEGKFYPPDAGKGPSWSFRVDPDVGIPKVVTTTKKEPLRPVRITTTGYFHFPTKGIYTYTIWSTPYTTYTYKTTVWPHGKPPSAYPKPGSPECGGIADLELRGVGGGGLYVTDSGMLVQRIDVGGFWIDTSYQVKCGRNWCSKPCGERIGDAWIFVRLNPAKLKGGRPIYVEVSDKDVKKFISYVESEASVIRRLEQEAAAGDENAERIRWLGHVEESSLEQTVPWAWFPENSTLKLKLTGFPKVMEDYGYAAKTIHYYVYIAPPEGQMFKLKTETKWCHIYHGGRDMDCYNRKMPWGYKWEKRLVTKLVLVEAESTPTLVTTTLTKIVQSGAEVRTETYTTTMTVNKLVEKTVTLEIEKTVTLEKTTTKITTIQGQPTTVIQTVPVKTTVTQTVPMKTTITVKAPATTYVITDPQQAEQVAAVYQPPKPLAEIIYEKLMEFWNWLVSLLGLR